MAVLQDEILALSARLTEVESRSGSPSQRHTSRSVALHREATDLRRDISEARFPIERLHRRFPEVAPAAQLTRGRLALIHR